MFSPFRPIRPALNDSTYGQSAQNQPTAFGSQHLRPEGASGESTLRRDFHPARHHRGSQNTPVNLPHSTYFIKPRNSVPIHCIGWVVNTNPIALIMQAKLPTQSAGGLQGFWRRFPLRRPCGIAVKPSPFVLFEEIVKFSHNPPDS
jgi:hypothetical protein